MNWEICKRHLEATGLLYSPVTMRLPEDPCPLPESTSLKSIMADISDILTGGSIRIPITRLAELRFHCGYFDLVKLFLDKFFNTLFKKDNIKMKTRIVQKWGVKKYHEIFSFQERTKLEDNEPNSWDIALIYKVIQVECLRMNGHEWMILDQVLNLLKAQLHQLAHKDLHFDKAEIVVRTTYLSKILNKICEEGSKINRVHHRDMKALSEWIDPSITCLTLLIDRKNLTQEDFDTIPDLEEKIAEYKRHLEFGLKCTMKLEVFVRHLFYFSSSKLFSKLSVHERESAPDCNTHEVDYKTIFELQLKDGSAPDIYIISGPRGVGKSLYLKYISQQSYEDPMSIPGVNKFEVIFTAQFRDENIGCLKDLIRFKLPNTLKDMEIEASEVESIVQRGNILIMMDGYDEVTSETQNLLMELMNYGSNIKLMCTTRSEDVQELIEKIPSSRNYVHLKPIVNTQEENNISNENTMAWIKKNVDHSPHNEPLINELTAQTKMLCSFVERLLGASMIIRKSKGKIDVNTQIILKDFLNDLEEFRKDFDLSMKKNVESGYKELNVDLNEIKEMKKAEQLVKNVLNNPENLMKEFKDERYFELKREFKDKEPPRQRIFASMEELANVGSRVTDCSFLIDHNSDAIDTNTRKTFWELVRDIQDVREQCEAYNSSLPANVTKKLPFTGLQYWFRKITSPYLRQDLSKYCNEMVHIVDSGDNKLRRYLLTPEKTAEGPKLAEPWKGEADIEDVDKKTNWKPNPKTKKAKSKKKKH